MTNFQFYLNKALNRLERKNKEPEFVKKCISNLYDSIKDFKKENPNLSSEDLDDFFKKDFEDICDAVFASTHIFSKCINYQCCLYFENNKEEFISYLEKIKNPCISIPEEYGNNFESNLLLFTKFFKEDYNVFMDSFRQEPFKSTFDQMADMLKSSDIKPSEKKKIFNSVLNNISPIHRPDFKIFCDCITQGEYAYLKVEGEDIKKELKDDLVTSISSIGSCLDKLGFLEKYPILQQKANNHLLNTDKFNYSLDSLSNDNLGVRAMLSKEYLANKNIEKLLGLNTFWLNRFIKELDTYFEAIYTCHQLDLFSKMLDGTLDITNLETQDIKKVLTKMNIFYMPTYEFWSYAKDNKEEFGSTKIKNKNYYLIDNSSLLTYLSDDIGEEYSYYFNNIENSLPKNDFLKDLDLFWKIYTPIYNAYQTKDDNILASLSLPKLTNTFSHNWGVVIDGNPKETMYSPKSPINLWIDIEGLNFPLRQHMYKKTLVEYLDYLNDDSNSNKYIPIYKDPKAFDNLSTHLLLPYTKKQIAFLKDNKKTNFKGFDCKAKGFLEHSLTLVNSKNFKKSKINTTTQYLNLDDLNYYIMDENGNYILYHVNPEPTTQSSNDELNFE